MSKIIWRSEVFSTCKSRFRPWLSDWLAISLAPVECFGWNSKRWQIWTESANWLLRPRSAKCLALSVLTHQKIRLLDFLEATFLQCHIQSTLAREWSLTSQTQTAQMSIDNHNSRIMVLYRFPRPIGTKGDATVLTCSKRNETYWCQIRGHDQTKHLQLKTHQSSWRLDWVPSDLEGLPASWHHNSQIVKGTNPHSERQKSESWKRSTEVVAEALERTTTIWFQTSEMKVMWMFERLQETQL